MHTILPAFKERKQRIILIAALTGVCCYLAYYFHTVLGNDTIFTHFFYLPIILASLWWGRRGIFVAVFLAGLDLITRSVYMPHIPIFSDALRSIMFIVIAGVVAVLSEQITKDEKQLEHLNLVLRAIRNVNQLIIKEKDRGKLLEGTCKNLIKTRGYHNAWIVLLDESGKLTEYATSGLEKDFLPMVERLKQGRLPACGQRALKQPEVVVTRDPVSDCADCPLSNSYAGRAGMTVRLEHSGKLYGLLSVSIPLALANDEEELGLFHEVADDIAFALNNIEMEEKVSVSEERYRSVFENTGTATVIIEEDGIISMVNEEFVKLSGYLREELEGKKSWTEFVVKEDLDRMMQNHKLRRTDAGSTPRHYEFRGVYSEGNIKNIYMTVAPIPGTGKSVASLLDITERKEMEEELEGEHRLFIGGPTVVFKWTAADGWPIDYASPNVYGLLGYTAKELMDGRHLCRDTLHPDDVPRVAEENKRAERQADCGQLATEYRILDKDGKIRWVHEHAMLIRDGAGQVKYHHGYVTDITEQKKAEAEKQELERKAQVSSRLTSVGEMAAGIAHEINNPLTGVIGFSELLLQKDLPEDLKEEVQIICDGAKRVAGIVNRLLAFARQHKPERTFTDINEIIESTLALRKYSLETGNIDVNTQFDAGLPCTVADTGQLQQVFMNIIVNAEAEMKKAHGRGKLTIKTEQIDNKIRLSFADDGPGIARENIGKIFDPFFTTREVGEGTGLGLSLSYGIIAEHKGAMYAESEVGKGATFIIELPIVAEEEEKIETVEEAGQAIGGRILVVDDEPAILVFLKRVLGGEGYDVETADSGKEALGMIKNKRYSLILCDIKLPGLSGVEIYDEIGKTAPSLQKRVIFITGDVTSADTGEFLKRTKAPYVNKPFDIAKLKEEVERVIAGVG